MYLITCTFFSSKYYVIIYDRWYDNNIVMSRTFKKNILARLGHCTFAKDVNFHTALEKFPYTAYDSHNAASAVSR